MRGKRLIKEKSFGEKKVGSLHERLGPRKDWQNGDVGKSYRVIILDPESQAVCAHTFPLKDNILWCLRTVIYFSHKRMCMFFCCSL